MTVRTKHIPEATVYRLSLYHCYLGELVRVAGRERITSRQLAEELGIKEETVRRDLSFIGSVGRRGAGYEVDVLFDALQEFLGLSDEYPIVKVGSAQMLEALSVVFPSSSYGVRPVAYYSELTEDVGKFVEDIEVRHVSDIPKLDRGLDVSVALVATSPDWVHTTLDMLRQAGVTGVLLLTPMLMLERPEGMAVTHVRMPCDIKSLACQCHLPGAVKADATGVMPPINEMQSR
ncbi:MAG: redox-sensing transcriptional repressor Rex [Coriobacteriales bacterium]|nr:redox-sensing transcriptional repressor Rex [Coriobacteriales bacterium]